MEKSREYGISPKRGNLNGFIPTPNTFGISFLTEEDTMVKRILSFFKNVEKSSRKRSSPPPIIGKGRKITKHTDKNLSCGCFSLLFNV